VNKTDWLVGFSESPDGKMYLIGMGPQEWLAARLHAGCSKLVTRLPQDRDFWVATAERDLSGETLRSEAA